MRRAWRCVVVMIGVACLTAGLASATAFAAVDATEGQQFSGPVGEFIETCGAIGDEAVCGAMNVTVDWGDGTSDSSATLGGPGLCGGEFPYCDYVVSDSHTYADEGTYATAVNWRAVVPNASGGTYTVSGAVTGTITVGDAPLVAAAGSTTGGLEGSPVSTTASFADTNPVPDPSDISATIDWGDGTTSAGAVVGAGPDYTINGTHAYARPGIYPVVVMATDIGGAAVSIPSSASIAALPVPVTTITALPPPVGTRWWYRGPVHVVIAADEPGGAVAQTRCALDPLVAPPSFGALPAGCGFTGSGANVTGDGVHRIYAASIDSSGQQEAPSSSTIEIDATPPSVTCASAPTFMTGTTGGRVAARVSDATSGAVAATVSSPAPDGWPGVHAIALTGYDRAGNAATALCAYRDLGRLSSSVQWRIDARRRYSTVTYLKVRNVPAGSQIAVTCAQFRTRTIAVHPHRGSVDLTRMFGGAHLPVGSQLTIAISKPFMIGKVLTLTIRAGRQPMAVLRGG